MKQSLTTVKSVVSVVQVVDEHLSANTDGNIVPSESEYVPVHAVADGSVKHVFLFIIFCQFHVAGHFTFEALLDNIQVCSDCVTGGGVALGRHHSGQGRASSVGVRAV